MSAKNPEDQVQGGVCVKDFPMKYSLSHHVGANPAGNGSMAGGAGSGWEELITLKF